MKPRMFGARWNMKGWGWQWFIEWDGVIYSTGVTYSARNNRIVYVADIARYIVSVRGYGYVKHLEADIIRRVDNRVG